MMRRRARRRSRAALAAVLSLGLAGCALGAVIAQARDAQRPQSGHPAVIAHDPRPTPLAPPRPREAAKAVALPTSAAARLAAPPCATYRDALSGRYPDVVLRRGSGRALAVVTQSVGAALLGLPVVVPPDAGGPSRDRLATSLERLDAALGRGGEAAPDVIAKSVRPRLRAYAHALGIDACG